MIALGVMVVDVSLSSELSTRGGKGYQETLLVDTHDRMRRNPEGRKVVHLHLSQLMPPNRTPVRIKIVTRMFRTLESGCNAQNAAARRILDQCERLHRAVERVSGL